MNWIYKKVGDSMLNGISEKGSIGKHNVQVINIPCPTSERIFGKDLEKIESWMISCDVLTQVLFTLAKMTWC